jgi:hypothetical protein
MLMIRMKEISGQNVNQNDLARRGRVKSSSEWILFPSQRMFQLCGRAGIDVFNYLEPLIHAREGKV